MDRKRTLASSYFKSPSLRSHGFHCLRGKLIVMGKMELWVEYKSTYGRKRFMIQTCPVALGFLWRTFQVNFFVPKESEEFEVVFKLDFDDDDWMQPLRLLIDEISIGNEACNIVGKYECFNNHSIIL